MFRIAQKVVCCLITASFLFSNPAYPENAVRKNSMPDCLASPSNVDDITEELGVEKFGRKLSPYQDGFVDEFAAHLIESYIKLHSGKDADEIHRLLTEGLEQTYRNLQSRSMSAAFYEAVKQYIEENFRRIFAKITGYDSPGRNSISLGITPGKLTREQSWAYNRVLDESRYKGNVEKKEIVLEGELDGEGKPVVITVWIHDGLEERILEHNMEKAQKRGETLVPVSRIHPGTHMGTATQVHISRFYWDKISDYYSQYLMKVLRHEYVHIALSRVRRGYEERNKYSDLWNYYTGHSYTLAEQPSEEYFADHIASLGRRFNEVYQDNVEWYDTDIDEINLRLQMAWWNQDRIRDNFINALDQWKIPGIKKAVTDAFITANETKDNEAILVLFDTLKKAMDQEKRFEKYSPRAGEIKDIFDDVGGLFPEIFARAISKADPLIKDMFVKPETDSPGFFSISPAGKSNKTPLFIAAVNLLDGDVKQAVDFIFSDSYSSDIASKLSEMSNLILEDYSLLSVYHRSQVIRYLDAFYSYTVKKALSLESLGTSFAVQRISANTTAFLSWMDREVPGAQYLRVTSKPEKMLAGYTKEKTGEDKLRGLSYINIDSVHDAGLGYAKYEGQPGMHDRGTEGRKKLAQNVIDEAFYAKDDFALENMMLYGMLHGFLNVPDALRELTEKGDISTIHETVFINGRIPGSAQHGSTGTGHWQGDKLDIKYVTKGRIRQMIDIYDENGKVVKTIVHEAGEGDATFAIPGAVDYMIPLTDVVMFNDFSVKIEDKETLRKLNPDIDFSKMTAIEKAFKNANHAAYASVTINMSEDLVSLAPDLPETEIVRAYKFANERLGNISDGLLGFYQTGAKEGVYGFIAAIADNIAAGAEKETQDKEKAPGIVMRSAGDIRWRYFTDEIRTKMRSINDDFTKGVPLKNGAYAVIKEGIMELPVWEAMGYGLLPLWPYETGKYTDLDLSAGLPYENMGPFVLSDEQRTKYGIYQVNGVFYDGNLHGTYNITKNCDIRADKQILGSLHTLHVESGTLTILDTTGKELAVVSAGSDILCPANMGEYFLQAGSEEDAKVSVYYQPRRSEGILFAAKQAVSNNLAKIQSTKVRLIAENAIFKKGGTKDIGSLGYEKRVLGQLTNGAVSINDWSTDDRLMKLLSDKDQETNYVILITRSTFDEISGSAAAGELRNKMNAERIIVLPEPELDKGLPFLREIECAGVVLGNTTQQDITEQKAIAEWLLVIMKQLTGNKNLSLDDIRALISTDSQGGVTLAERFRALINELLVTLPARAYDAEEELSHRREVLWSA